MRFAALRNEYTGLVSNLLSLDTLPRRRATLYPHRSRYQGSADREPGGAQRRLPFARLRLWERGISTECPRNDCLTNLAGDQPCRLDQACRSHSDPASSSKPVDTGFQSCTGAVGAVCLEVLDICEQRCRTYEPQLRWVLGSGWEQRLASSTAHQVRRPAMAAHSWACPIRAQLEDPDFSLS